MLASDKLADLRQYFNTHECNRQFNEKQFLSGKPLPSNHVAILPNHNLAYLEASKASQKYGVQLYVYDNEVLLTKIPDFTLGHPSFTNRHKKHSGLNRITVYYREPKLDTKDLERHDQLQTISDIIANEPSDRAVEAQIKSAFGSNATDLYEIIQDTRTELAELNPEYRSMTTNDIRQHIIDVVMGKADRLTPNWQKPKRLSTEQYNKHNANGIVRCDNMKLARLECIDRITLTGKHDPNPDNRPLKFVGRWIKTGETYIKTIEKNGVKRDIEMPVKKFLKYKNLDMIERPRSVALCKHMHKDASKRLGFFAIDNYEPERDPHEELYGPKKHWNIMERYTWDPEMKVFPVDSDQYKFKVEQFNNDQVETDLATWSITYRNWMGDTCSVTRTAINAQSAQDKAKRFFIETGQSGEILDVEMADADTLSETTVDLHETLFNDEYEESVEEYLNTENEPF